MTGEAGEQAATLEVAFTASRQFTAWLAERRASLSFTTHQVGEQFLTRLRAAYDPVLAVRHANEIKAERPYPGG